MENAKLQNDQLLRSDNYVIRTVKNRHFLIPVKWRSSDRPCIVVVNDIGLEIWGLLDQKTKILDVVRSIGNKYSISEKVVFNDVQEFVVPLISIGAIKADNIVCNKGLKGNSVIESEDFLQRIVEEEFNGENLPISLTWELTHRCNLNCIHCYLSQNQKQKVTKELTTEEIEDLIDQASEIGCFQVILTGGDPLIRKDFSKIVAKIRNKGLFYSLYTNAIAINKEVVDVLKEFPPIAIEVSIYGITAKTYETITQINGSYKRLRTGIELLVRDGFNVRLKTVLMRNNLHELSQIRDFADSMDLEFRSDAFITPTIDHLKYPKELRVQPEDIVISENINSGLVRKSRRVNRRGFYKCGAGKYEANIDPRGRLSLCLLDRSPFISLRKYPLKDGWDGLREIRKMSYPEKSKCKHCRLFDFCKICPGWLKIEGQPLHGKINFLCSVAKERFKRYTYKGGGSCDPKPNTESLR